MLDFWSLFPTLIRWKSQMSVLLIYGFPKFLKIAPPAENLRLLNFPVQQIEKTEGKLYPCSVLKLFETRINPTKLKSWNPVFLCNLVGEEL